MAYPIEEVIKLNNLFDLYQPLFTEKQRDYFIYYFREDYSLSEIAEFMGVSRNAVHLQIKKITNYLHNYEDKLSLLKKKKIRESLVDEILTDFNLEKEIQTKIEKIKKV